MDDYSTVLPHDRCWLYRCDRCNKWCTTECQDYVFLPPPDKGDREVWETAHDFYYAHRFGTADPSPRIQPSSNGRKSITPVVMKAEPQAPDVVSYLRGKGFEVKDNREAGGMLWVVGGAEELDKPLDYCVEKFGISFWFRPEGGKSVGNRPAWMGR
jgi:hypothetical protein